MSSPSRKQLIAVTVALGLAVGATIAFSERPLPVAAAGSPAVAPGPGAGPDNSAAAAAAPPATKPVIRFAADPNNLPFSNDRCEGFEQRIADLIARDLGAEPQFVWRPQRRGFFREMLKEGRADAVIGVPEGLGPALTTRPFYRSGYVLVQKSITPPVSSLDDPRLRTMRIGVQLVGDDGMNTPPAHALARRGLVDNLAGYTVYGDYRQADPPARIVRAVADGEVDIAAVWGPLAGYFAPRVAPGGLDVRPIMTSGADAGLPMCFDLCVGVARGDTALRDRIQRSLDAHRPQIEAILREYGVPTWPVDAGASGGEP